MKIIQKQDNLNRINKAHYSSTMMNLKSNYKLKYKHTKQFKTRLVLFLM